MGQISRHAKNIDALTNDPMLQAFFASGGDADTAIVPIAPEHLGRPSMRMMRVEDDCMEPTLRNGDAVVAFPVSKFSGDGIYLVDNGYPRVYRVAFDGKGGIDLISDNKAYSAFKLTREQFNDIVLAKVSMLCNVIERPLWGS